jgi:hypothetical protein
VREAVERTLSEGGACVVVVARSTLAYGGNGTGELRLEGTIDFAGRRARLDGPTGAVVCDGPVQYSQLQDGRWTSQGEPGQWSNVDPRWSLEVLARCALDVRETAPRRYEMRFDTEAMGAITHAGLAPGWAASGTAQLDEAGRVARVDVRLREAAGALDWEVTLTGFGPARGVDLPPADRVIALSDYIEEFKRQAG